MTNTSSANNTSKLTIREILQELADKSSPVAKRLWRKQGLDI